MVKKEEVTVMMEEMMVKKEEVMVRVQQRGGIGGWEGEEIR